MELRESIKQQALISRDDKQAEALTLLALEGQKHFSDDSKLRHEDVGYKAYDKDHNWCSGCYFFEGSKCNVVGDIQFTGTCDLHLDAKAIEESMVDVEDEKEDDYEENRKGFFELVKGLFPARKKSKDIELSVGFKLLDDLGEEYKDHYILTYTNPYRDKEGEIFREKAIEADVKFMLDNPDFMPELWFSHLPASYHGKAKMVGKFGRFVWVYGKLEDNPDFPDLKQYMKAYYQTDPDLNVSHGYVYDKKAHINNEYHIFHTHETSPLPRGQESNPLTAFQLGAKNMNPAQTKQNFLNAGVPESLVDAMMAMSQSAGQKADELGIDRKSDDTVEAAQPEQAEKSFEEQFDKRFKASVAPIYELMQTLVDGQKALIDQLQSEDTPDEGEKAEEETPAPDPAPQFNPQMWQAMSDAQGQWSQFQQHQKSGQGASQLSIRERIIANARKDAGLE